MIFLYQILTTFLLVLIVPLSLLFPSVRLFLENGPRIKKEFFLKI